MIDSPTTLETTLNDIAPLLIGFAAVFGALVGSFLNVVIYRVPRDLSVVSPRSACPTCQTPIAGYDNIPVISWLLLRGKCRGCASPISARYPLVEAFTAAAFAGLTWYLLGREPGLIPWFLVLAAGCIALAIIDLETKRLPQPITVTLAIVSIPGFIVAGLVSGEWPLLRVALSALMWLLVFGIPWYATAGRGVGFGDVKLAPVIGAALGWLGWSVSVVGLAAGLLLGTVVGLGLIVASRAGRKTAVPYGPFMITGAAASVFVGVPIGGFYLQMTGLA